MNLLERLISKNKDNPVKTRTSFHVETDLYKKCRKLCRSNKVKFSDLINLMLREVVETFNNEKGSK